MADKAHASHTSNPKSKPPRANAAETSDAFALELERALEHVNDTEWLIEHSSLAAPYFLGNAEDGAEPGVGLQHVLKTCAQRLSQNHRTLLNAAYFQRNPNLNNVGVALSLGLIDRTFYRQRTLAVAALADELFRTVRPALHPEQPAPADVVPTLNSRQPIYAAAWAALGNRQSVSFVGPSGIGKTTLAAHLFRAWAKDGPAFWHTLRPGLTDQLDQLGFALAFALHRAQAGMTWRQLNADQGRVQPDRLLALLRHDLAQLHHPMLLCIDEADALHADNPAHARVLQCLEALQADAPLLLIGQRTVLVTAHTHLIDRVDVSESRALLINASQISLTDAQAQRAHSATQGNPAMLGLFASLYRLMGDADQAIAQLGADGSYDALFQRIWRRLSEDEKYLLMHAAVFDGPAYFAIRPAQTASLNHLKQLGLLIEIPDSSMLIVSHIRRTVRDRTPAEAASELQLLAAHECERHGQTVSAMRHYCLANQPAHAIRLWMLRRAHAIDQGQGSAALAVLQAIDANQIASKPQRDMLYVARAQLLSLTGQVDEQAEAASRIRSSSKIHLRAYARMVQGDAAMLRNQLEHSLQHYADSLDELVDAPQIVQSKVLQRISRLHAHQGDLAKAHAAAIQSRIASEIAHGGIEERIGNYAQAEQRYHAALELAQALPQNEASLSMLYSYLGQLQWKLGRPDDAIAQLQEAVRIGTARGDVVGTLFDRYTISAAHIVAGRFQAGLDEATDTLALARGLGSAYLIAGLTGNAAEACVGLGQFDQAERLALESLAQEEDSLRTYALTALGQVFAARGQADEATRYLRASVDAARTCDDVYAEAAAWRALYLAHKAAGSSSAAAEARSMALAIYKRLGLQHEIAGLS
jgi:ATP/maltotriose-dependent transcriptional regulator MalT